ncbi:hypothetical protein [Methylobacter luteus]|uniref:hypothetical protein n=1 Tax=Methylobacter luteus TaxID=415 RepID=UPI0012DCD076|nr:hypothetical protein [Methylobacter luteus]
MKKLILLSTITLTGCSVTRMAQDAAAGSIGCPSNQIKISNWDYKMIPGSTVFSAECQGIRFECSQQTEHSETKCTKALIQPSKETVSLYKQPELSKEECLRRKTFNSLLKCN